MSIQALRLVASARSHPSQRLLDAIYGPSARDLRAKIATVLHGNPVSKSHKLAQYGSVRAALIGYVGATGNCIAAVDADFEAKASTLLFGEPATV